jgi:hypothetical protein
MPPEQLGSGLPGPGEQAQPDLRDDGMFCAQLFGLISGLDHFKLNVGIRVEQFHEFRHILIHTLPGSLSSNKDNRDLLGN